MAGVQLVWVPKGSNAETLAGAPPLAGRCGPSPEAVGRPRCVAADASASPGGPCASSSGRGRDCGRGDAAGAAIGPRPPEAQRGLPPTVVPHPLAGPSAVPRQRGAAAIDLATLDAALAVERAARVQLTEEFAAVRAQLMAEIAHLKAQVASLLRGAAPVGLTSAGAHNGNGLPAPPPQSQPDVVGSLRQRLTAAPPGLGMGRAFNGAAVAAAAAAAAPFSPSPGHGGGRGGTCKCVYTEA